MTPLLPPIHPLSMRADDGTGLVVVFSAFPGQQVKVNPDADALRK